MRTAIYLRILNVPSFSHYFSSISCESDRTARKIGWRTVEEPANCERNNQLVAHLQDVANLV